MSSRNEKIMKKISDKERCVNHTPGPWRQGGVEEILLNNKFREIVADDARIGLVYGVSDEDNKANARLIAAAPDMLAALLRIRNDLTREYNVRIFNVNFQYVNDAINQASDVLSEHTEESD